MTIKYSDYDDRKLSYYLMNSRIKYDYFKIIVGNKYIVISYNRDNSVVISSNYISTSLWIDIERVMKMPTINRVEEFFRKWIPKLI